MAFGKALDYETNTGANGLDAKTGSSNNWEDSSLQKSVDGIKSIAKNNFPDRNTNKYVASCCSFGY